MTLNSNEELLNAILDSIGDGLYTVDKDFKITSFNPSAEKITGISAQKALNKFCKYVLRTDKCEQGCPLAVTLEKGHNIYDYKMQIQNRFSQKLSVKVNTAILFDSMKRPVGGVISFREDAPCLFLEDELKHETHFDGMIGRSQKMREIFTLIEEIADSDENVLIQGESGTGKEMIANAIQRRSNRTHKPFIKINCSVFPETLLASELFGHVRGAFTGAQHERIGRFDAANGGTLFLDEIGEASLLVQVQLLRVLQDGTFERIGDSITRNSDVRIIAATNLNIENALQAGKFREDLYYRLNVIPITVPPLRERKMDIPFLVQYFIQKYRKITDKPIFELDDRAMDIFTNYDWPGNVRELENIIAYLFARTKENIISADKIPSKFQKSKLISSHIASSAHDEPRKIAQILSDTQWNKTKAAKQLGIGRTTLWRKMKQLGLDKVDLPE